MVTSNNKQLGFNSIDILSLSCLLGGSVITILNQKIVLAVIPLSLAVALEIFNRQQQLVKLQTQTKKELVKNDHLLEETLKVQKAKLTKLETKLTSAIESSEQKKQDYINNIIIQLEEVKKTLANLSREVENLNVEKEEQQQANIPEVIIPEVESQKGSAQFYYERGVGYQKLNDIHQAIEDYSQAISLNAEYVDAYYSRGLLQAKLNNSKPAIEDLRHAAKLYFKQNNLEGYRKTRLLCKQLYNLPVLGSNEQNTTTSNKPLSVNQLFTLE